MSCLCSSLEDSVLKKETKTTLTLFLVCLSFLIFNVPFTILETLEDAEITSLGASYIRLLMYFLYWFQYSFNFFLYAAACEQYRRAYIYFIKCIYFAVNLLTKKVVGNTYNSWISYSFAGKKQIVGTNLQSTNQHCTFNSSKIHILWHRKYITNVLYMHM